MQLDSTLPEMRLDPSAVPAEHRFEQWHQYIKARWDVVPTAESLEDPGAWVMLRLMHNMVWSDVSYGPQQLSRLKHHIRREESPFIAVRFTAEGVERGLYDDQPLTSDASNIQVFDMAKEKRLVSTRLRQYTVTFPYAVIGYDPDRDRLPRDIPVASATGQMLRASVFSMFDDITSIAGDSAEAISAGVAGMLRGVLLPERPQLEAAAPHLPQARKRAMLNYIDQHLMDEELGADALCQVFNASRATVYRLLAEEGGVQHHVTMRRLDRAFQDLAGGPARHGIVGQVARRWGFHDKGHFTRLFRKRFGLVPSDVIATDVPTPCADDRLAMAGALASEQIPDLRDWFRRL